MNRVTNLFFKSLEKVSLSELSRILNKHIIDEINTEVWDDLRAPATGINPAGSVAPPSVNTGDGSLTFSANDAICTWFQMPHAWKEGSDINIHIHWSKATSASGTVKWQMKYKWANRGNNASF